jgi:voltage-gated potassium channel
MSGRAVEVRTRRSLHAAGVVVISPRTTSNVTGFSPMPLPVIGGTIVLIAFQEGSDVMARLLVKRRYEAFLRDPLSVRTATSVIVAATLVSVIVGGVLITLVDRKEFPDLGTGLWWALQTVTTVGYGDVTPENTAGRLVGALFMLEAIAFVTIVTAVITSGFVERARQQRIADSETAEAVGIEQLTAQLSEITSRLERIQQTLDPGGSAGARSTLR